MKKEVRKVTSSKGIRKVLVWDKKNKKYTAPKSGFLFQASRYEPQIKGKPKRVFCSFKTIGEAKKWQAFLLQQETAPYKTPREFKKTNKLRLVRKSNNSVKLVQTNQYNLLKLFEEFKQYKFPFLSMSSRHLYEQQFRLCSFLFQYEVQKISPEVIDQWIAYLIHPNRRASYKTSRFDFKKELDCLRAILNWYIKYKRISNWTNPVRKEHYEMSKIRNKRVKERNFMTEDEKKIWYQSLKKHKPLFYPPAFIQTEQMMRVSEVFAMTWKNLDFKNKTYLITHHIYWPKEKNPKPALVQGTKTQKEVFLMPLRKAVIDLLKKIKKEESCPYIFHNKGELHQYKHIQNGYNKAFKMADLPFRSTHVCRHTGATLFLEKTGDPLALQEMGNWRTQKQSMHYGRILKQRVRRAIDKIDQADSSQ